MKKNVSLIVAIVLGVLLACALIYIGIGLYQQAKENVYKSGYDDGINSTFTYIIQQAGSCQTVPLTDANNQTITLLAYECLTQAQNRTS